MYCSWALCMYVGVNAWIACLLILLEKHLIILHQFQGQNKSSRHRNIHGSLSRRYVLDVCIFKNHCARVRVLEGHMYVHQQSRMAVASDSLVHRRESVFGAEVNMSPSLDQHSDGLTSTGFTLHGKGQGSFCQRNKHTTHLLIEKKEQENWNVPFNRHLEVLWFFSQWEEWLNDKNWRHREPMLFYADNTIYKYILKILDSVTTTYNIISK